MMFEKDILNEIINIGPDEEFITINHLYNLISNKLKFNKDPKYMASRPNEVYEAMCSSDKARELLDYKTTVSLNKSMDKMIKFIKSSGTREFEYNYPIEIDNNVTPDTWSKKLF